MSVKLNKQPRECEEFQGKISSLHAALTALARLVTLKKSASLTFPIHESDRMVQSHFVFEFFSKCRCMAGPGPLASLSLFSFFGSSQHLHLHHVTHCFAPSRLHSRIFFFLFASIELSLTGSFAIFFSLLLAKNTVTTLMFTFALLHCATKLRTNKQSRRKAENFYWRAESGLFLGLLDGGREAPVDCDIWSVSAVHIHTRATCKSPPGARQKLFACDHCVPPTRSSLSRVHKLFIHGFSLSLSPHRFSHFPTSSSSHETTAENFSFLLSSARLGQEIYHQNENKKREERRRKYFSRPKLVFSVSICISTLNGMPWTEPINLSSRWLVSTLFARLTNSITSIEVFLSSLLQPFSLRPFR
jgi:hypothetical protein